MLESVTMGAAYVLPAHTYVVWTFVQLTLPLSH